MLKITEDYGALDRAILVSPGRRKRFYDVTNLNQDMYKCRSSRG